LELNRQAERKLLSLEEIGRPKLKLLGKSRERQNGDENGKRKGNTYGVEDRRWDRGIGGQLKEGISDLWKSSERERDPWTSRGEGRDLRKTEGGERDLWKT
jgi:hypothetical protein